MKEWDQCENLYDSRLGAGHVPRWRFLRIQVKPHSRDVRTQMIRENDGEDSQYGGDGETLADLLDPGDNFAVPAMPGNDEGVEFYLFFCQRAKYQVTEAFTCKWGHSFLQGDYAVSGSYYQVWGLQDRSYVLLDRLQNAYLLPELVVQVKFSMSLQDHRVQSDDSVYYLSLEDQQTIASECSRR
jgi:hypothetical protein